MFAFVDVNKPSTLPDIVECFLSARQGSGSKERFRTVHCLLLFIFFMLFVASCCFLLLFIASGLCLVWCYLFFVILADFAIVDCSRSLQLLCPSQFTNISNINIITIIYPYMMVEKVSQSKLNIQQYTDMKVVMFAHVGHI